MDTRETLEERLARDFGCPVELVMTRNRRVFLSWRLDAGGLVRLRLHEVFLEADSRTLAAVKCLVQKRNMAEARGRLRRFVDARRPGLPPPARRRRTLVPRGRTHDLEAIQRALSERYFEGRVHLPITWGRRQHRRPVARVRLGSYDYITGIIRIHPLLDQRRVPVYVVEHTVYHEMLHAVMGFERRGRRRILHPPGFRARERCYDRHEDAMKWLDAHLDTLFGEA